MLAFKGAKQFTAKDGTEFVAVPLDANNIYRGEKGSYLSITLMDNKDGQDQYGNEGFATVDFGKERREAGEKSPILGNWKTIGRAAPPPRQSTPPPTSCTNDELDDIPF